MSEVTSNVLLDAFNILPYMEQKFMTKVQANLFTKSFLCCRRNATLSVRFLQKFEGMTEDA